MAEGTTSRLGVSYFGNRYPHHARQDLRRIAESGAEFVVHVMSEADLRWNPATIGQLVAAGRDEGLTSWLTPWAVAGVFGGEAASYAVGEHPDACQRDNAGHALPALCPRQPAFRAVMAAWLAAAADTGAVVVQWDEPHLARSHRAGNARWACRCDACQAAFRDRFGREMPEAWSPDVERLLDDLLTETLAWLITTATTHGLQSAVVLHADEAASPAYWRAVAALPGVLYFGCTPYWLFAGIPREEMASYVRRWGERIMAATTGTNVEPIGWVQAFGVPAGREAEVERAIAELAGTGVSTIAAWSYLACVAMSGLAADDPAATWAAVVRGFDRLDGGVAGEG